MITEIIPIHESSAPLFTPDGRIGYTERGLLMDWSMAGIRTAFSGRSVTLTFAPVFAEEAIFAEVTVDGVSSTHALYEKANDIVITVAPGEHTLTLHRISEGEEPLLLTEIRITAFDGERAALLPPPKKGKRRIVYIGDSITCGYGVLGAKKDEFFATRQEDPRLAYAWRSAQLVDADAELVSISGRGVVRNWNGEPFDIIPEFIRRQCRTLTVPHDFEGDVPDAVVINAGTNDHSSGLSADAFAEGVCALLKTVRGLYPASPILWVYGLMDAEFTPAVRLAIEKMNPELGNLHFLETESINRRPGELGANGHPCAMGAERAAIEVASKLKSILKI